MSGPRRQPFAYRRSDSFCDLLTGGGKTRDCHVVRWMRGGVRRLPAGKPDTGELPTCLRREEIAVAGPNMCCRSDARTSPQDHLAAHEFSVIFAQRTGQRLETWVAEIRACSPLPTVAEELGRNPTSERPA